MTSDGLVRLGRISGSDALANCGMLHRGDALLWARRPGEPLVKFGIDLAAALLLPAPACVAPQPLLRVQACAAPAALR